MYPAHAHTIYNSILNIYSSLSSLRLPWNEKSINPGKVYNSCYLGIPFLSICHPSFALLLWKIVTHRGIKFASNTHKRIRHSIHHPSPHHSLLGCLKPASKILPTTFLFPSRRPVSCLTVTRFARQVQIIRRRHLSMISTVVRRGSWKQGTHATP